MKIRYLGKLIRDDEGKFAKKKKRSGMFKKFVLGAVLIYGVFLAGGFFQPRAIAVPVLKDNLTPKIEELKDKVIEQLAQCESKNAPQEMAIVKYDNNSKGTLTGKHVASIGVMQFKVGTVQDFYKTLHKKSLTNYEATLLALDNQKAKQFAKEAIFGIKGAIHHWSCADSAMVAQVTMIKSLEK